MENTEAIKNNIVIADFMTESDDNELFTDEMAQNIFVFQRGLSSEFTTYGKAVKSSGVFIKTTKNARVNKNF